MLEADAANNWGIDFDPDVITPGSWFTLPRTSRAVKVAHYQLNSLAQGLREYDAKPYWEQHYAEKRPPRRGGRSNN